MPLPSRPGRRTEKYLKKKKAAADAFDMPAAAFGFFFDGNLFVKAVLRENRIPFELTRSAYSDGELHAIQENCTKSI